MPVTTRRSAAAGQVTEDVADPLTMDKDKERKDQTAVDIVDTATGVVQELCAGSPEGHVGDSQSQVSVDRKSNHSGSKSSYKSTSSSKRRQLMIEEQKIALDERQRQVRLQMEIATANARAEDERIEAERRLLELRSQVAEEEEEELERRSDVLSVSSGEPDVTKWVKNQARFVENMDKLPEVDEDSDKEIQPSREKEAPDFQKLTDCFAQAMKSVVDSVRPNDDLRNFAARQTGAKDLPEFHGNPEEWPAFFGRFQQSTKLCGFSDEENVLRLQKALKGKAKESVLSMLSSACNLDEILKVLKKRFGRPDQIIKKVVEKARSSPAPTDGDMQSLLDFAIVVKNLCATADTLKLPEYLSNPQLLEELSSKLPPHIMLDWGKHVVKSGKKADLIELSKFLDDVSSAAIIVHRDNSSTKKVKNKDQCLVVVDVQCLLKCRDVHSLDKCPKFKKMKVADRWEVVKKNRVCFVCLEKGHSRQKCPKPILCGLDNCTKEHHKLLHNQIKNADGDGKLKVIDGVQKPAVAADGVMGVVSQKKSPLGNVLMKIVPVRLTGPKGSVIVNAFLDDGSSLTMIDDDVANTIGLDGECNPLHLNWLNGRCEYDNESKVVSLKIQGVDEDEEFELCNVRTKACLKLPVVPLSNYKLLKKWTHLEDVPFPSVKETPPRIVIGSDHSFLLVGRKVVEGPRNAPVATWTYLGWTIHGPNGTSGLKTSHASMLSIEGMNPDEALHELVKEQFRLESLGVVNCEKLPQSRANKRANEIMEATSRKVNNRWETGMLWKSDDVTLPESYSAAARRLKVLEKQMDKDESFANLYCSKIEEYLAKGFCRKLDQEEAAMDNGRVWYLPHFGRTNPNKPGKLRLVFDCAAKVNGMSLNDALIQGPDLMSPLINVLLKFRQFEVAFSGDIRDMFHMVRIRQEDVPALRFLWRGKDRSRPPSVYTMDVMVFGAVSSPYQAQWIKNRNAEEFQLKYPEAVDAIHNRHYVDDYLDSCPTTEEAIQKIIQVREIHRCGGFEIRGWLSNIQDVVKVVSPGEATDAVLKVKEDNLERVLGLHWDPQTDVFKFKLSFRNVDPAVVSGHRNPTKREVLKLVMSLYDPLGFIAHLTVKGRMLLQDIWKTKTGWDEVLPLSLASKWNGLLEQIKSVTSAEISRCYASFISDIENVELHVFCDASSQAFCCSAYLRATGRGGEVSVNIVMAKSRVAPVKTVSIPRLELEAALIGARMSSFIRKNLDIVISDTVLWTDSKNVLYWIRAEDPSVFRMYAAHRVGEILDLTEVSMWRWVPTADNVADDATRDSAAADVSPSSRWFKGPTFLMEPKENWPKEKSVKLDDVNQEDLELKKNCCMVTTESGLPIDITKYSNWMKLLRVTAWILRFKWNSTAAHRKTEKRSGCLSANEIQGATALWIKLCQKESFSVEVCCLAEGRPLPRCSRLLRLSAFLRDGILCVKSRIENAGSLAVDVKYPAILDSKHPWTKLLISWYHNSHGHHGIELICNEIRQRFWITGLKSAVKKTARECMKCKLENAKQVVPEMAALPNVRVTRPERAFSFVGVDYFGPIDVVNGRKREKRYGALFTCLSTRAVHLEMANSLSTDDFLLVLNRFMARRGQPVEIWSDNGTNFRGAEKELRKSLEELQQDRIGDTCAMCGIKWNFIPPGSPHMGGAWERLVRSVKLAMTNILKNRTPNDATLSTVMAEAESSVNSRPLTAVSCDVNDPEALTPNCFLLGSTSIRQPPGFFPDGDLSLRKRWRHAQVLADHFWKRWLKEYLPSLSLRGKWKVKTPEIQIGELVFIPDPNQQRNSWKKGIVEALFPGKDGHVRVVEVRTANGIFKRPVANLLRIQDWNLE